MPFTAVSLWRDPASLQRVRPVEDLLPAVLFSTLKKSIHFKRGLKLNFPSFSLSLWYTPLYTPVLLGWASVQGFSKGNIWITTNAVNTTFLHYSRGSGLLHWDSRLGKGPSAQCATGDRRAERDCRQRAVWD